MLNKFFSWLTACSKTKKQDKHHRITDKRSIYLTEEGLSIAIDQIKKDIERVKDTDNQPSIAAELVSGELSENVNWMGIETIGNYISPIGNDNLHKVILTEKNNRGQNIKIAEIECTNQIYSEWISCLCETMWHTKAKVLQDIYGNKYPVGLMCEFKCSIRFM